jgi:hypothetical protein
VKISQVINDFLEFPGEVIDWDDKWAHHAIGRVVAASVSLDLCIIAEALIEVRLVPVVG